MFLTKHLPAARAIRGALLSGAMVFPGTATAANIGDMLANADFAAAIGRDIRFYNTSGTQIGDLAVPYPDGPAPITESLRDITQLGDGRLAVFNGTFNPYLSIFDFNTATWTHTVVPGWSTSNNSRFGGIASVGDLIFIIAEPGVPLLAGLSAALLALRRRVR